MRVLIADDSKTARHNLRNHLESWGFEIAEAADGDTAWEILNEPDSPRIAIIDWLMPGLDGLELCRRLHARDRGPRVYTILLTSKREEQDLIEALDAGAHSFLSKPVSPAALLSYIRVGQRLAKTDMNLEESERILRLIIETVSEGIMLFSEDFNLLDANSPALKMFGLKRMEYKAFGFCPLYDQAKRDHSPEMLRKIIGGFDYKAVWNRSASVTGVPEILDVYFKGLTIEDRRFLLAVFRDITLQKREEQQRMRAERLNAAIETAGAACHELNQPLQAVLTGLEVGMLQTEDGSDVNVRLRAIRSACMRMAEITHKLQGITEYQTKQYIGDKNILDIDRSSG